MTNGLTALWLTTRGKTTSRERWKVPDGRNRGHPTENASNPITLVADLAQGYNPSNRGKSFIVYQSFEVNNSQFLGQNFFYINYNKYHVFLTNKNPFTPKIFLGNEPNIRPFN